MYLGICTYSDAYTSIAVCTRVNSSIRSMRTTFRSDDGHACEQVYAVLKSVLDKLSLVGVIAVDPQEQAMVLTQSVGEEISTMIAEQRELEKKFEALINQQHLLRNAPNKNKKLVCT